MLLVDLKLSAVKYLWHNMQFSNVHGVNFEGGPKLPTGGETLAHPLSFYKNVEKCKNNHFFFIFPWKAYWEVPIAILTSNIYSSGFPGQLDLHQKWAKVSPVYGNEDRNMCNIY